MPNVVTSVGVRRDGDEVPRHRRLVAAQTVARSQARAVWAFVIVSSVVNVFDETMKSVSSGLEVAGRLGEVRAVDVGDEPERQVAPAVVAQRLVGHHRARGRSRRCRC